MPDQNSSTIALFESPAKLDLMVILADRTCALVPSEYLDTGRGIIDLIKAGRGGPWNQWSYVLSKEDKDARLKEGWKLVADLVLDDDGDHIRLYYERMGNAARRYFRIPGNGRF